MTMGRSLCGYYLMTIVTALIIGSKHVEAVQCKAESAKITSLQADLDKIKTENEQLRGMQGVVTQLQQQIQMMQAQGNVVDGTSSNELLEKDNEIATLVQQMKKATDENESLKSRQKQSDGGTTEAKSCSCTKEKGTINKLMEENKKLTKEMKEINDLNIQWQDKAGRSDKFMMEMAANLTKCQMEAISKVTEVRMEFEDRLKSSNQDRSDCKRENTQLYKDIRVIETASNKLNTKLKNTEELLADMTKERDEASNKLNSKLKNTEALLADMTKERDEALLVYQQKQELNDELQQEKKKLRACQVITSEKQDKIEQKEQDLDACTKEKEDLESKIKTCDDEQEAITNMHNDCIHLLTVQRQKYHKCHNEAKIQEAGNHQFKIYFFVAAGLLVLDLVTRLMSWLLKSREPTMLKHQDIVTELQRRKADKETNKRTNNKKRR